MVEILRLGIIVVQDNVFISLISTFLRQLGTSSAIDFLDNDGTGFGVCERNVECDIPVYEFYLVCQSVEYMLVGFITDLYGGTYKLRKILTLLKLNSHILLL